MGLGGCFLFGLRNGGFVSSRCREVRVGGFSPPTPLGRTDGPAPVAKNLIFCSHDCFDTCRPGGQPKVFPLDPLILFGDSTSCGRKGAGSAEGEPWVCPLPGRCRKKSKPEFEIPAQGAGPGWVLPRGVGGEKPPTCIRFKELLRQSFFFCYCLFHRFFPLLRFRRMIPVFIIRDMRRWFRLRRDYGLVMSVLTV